VAQTMTGSRLTAGNDFRLTAFACTQSKPHLEENLTLAAIWRLFVIGR